MSEFDALCRAWRTGVPVSYPVQMSDTEVLMAFIGDGRVAVPRLAQSRHRGESRVMPSPRSSASSRRARWRGFAHGDLSPYDLLDHVGRIVVIDLPQVVDVAANPRGLDFLYRDVVNVSTWFARRGLHNDPENLFAHLVALLW